jgi:hypothetical protein
LSGNDKDIDHDRDLDRRAAIARILRRRHRRNKPRAKSYATETSWAEYGPVTLTPAQSDRSFWSYAGYFLLLVLAFGFPFTLIFVKPSFDVFVIQDSPDQIEWFEFVGWALAALFVFCILLFVVVASSALWRVIRDNLGKPT